MMKPLVFLFAFALPAVAAEQTVEYAVRGLFQPDRKTVLSTAAKTLQNCRLVEVSYEKATATFVYDDEAQGFKKAKPEQVLQQINNQVRSLTNNTFSIVPQSTLGEDKLERIDFTVEGLDCLGCSYGLYVAVVEERPNLDRPGVERAYASFHDGRLSVYIDPTKTNREALAEVLKKKEIKVVENTAKEEAKPKN